ncbi:TIGR03086 family metal-binding protein [Streptomyces hilarionis]|uniref:TIGR03086 family metal-binding protein n=1 Tax=Streptomyces hilarionis TaxID=2839954 RepID=UPI00211A1062|nr:TIGR03086 family metal-binding protein [Streptomyces hilarionis]MCQ9131377.1 TIGR03086 family protein [Streptomyces hilarionis]
MTDRHTAAVPSEGAVQELDRRAVLRSAQIVARIRDDQWDAPTPCGDWTLRRLLAHMTAQHLGFAAAADGGPVDESVWRETPLADPRGAYAASVHRVLDAFAADGVLEREFVLPWIHPTMRFAAPRAIGFHLVDYVVHGWDVAVSAGLPAAYDDDLVAAAAEVAVKEVPVGPSRERPGAAFAPPVEPAGSTSAADRLLASLGRDPRWSPA